MILKKMRIMVIIYNDRNNNYDNNINNNNYGNNKHNIRNMITDKIMENTKMLNLDRRRLHEIFP